MMCEGIGEVRDLVNFYQHVSDAHIRKEAVEIENELIRPCRASANSRSSLRVPFSIDPPGMVPCLAALASLFRPSAILALRSSNHAIGSKGTLKRGVFCTAASGTKACLRSPYRRE